MHLRLSIYLLLPLVFLLLGLESYSQCSVCTQTTGDLEESAARGLNMGIVYLAMLPLSIILVIGYIFYKKTK